MSHFTLLYQGANKDGAKMKAQTKGDAPTTIDSCRMRIG